jgi:hypothetical protein
MRPHTYSQGMKVFPGDFAEVSGPRDSDMLILVQAISGNMVVRGKRLHCQGGGGGSRLLEPLAANRLTIALRSGFRSLDRRLQVKLPSLKGE